MSIGNQKGSSLIEVIMAMVIMALLVVGLNAGLVILINSNVSAKEVSSATAAGNALLEKLRTTNYNSIVTSSDVVKAKYLRSWTVTDDGTKKRVNVVVYWPQSQIKHTLELSTIIAKP